MGEKKEGGTKYLDTICGVITELSSIVISIDTSNQRDCTKRATRQDRLNVISSAPKWVFQVLTNVFSLFPSPLFLCRVLLLLFLCALPFVRTDRDHAPCQRRRTMAQLNEREGESDRRMASGERREGKRRGGERQTGGVRVRVPCMCVCRSLLMCSFPMWPLPSAFSALLRLELSVRFRHRRSGGYSYY